MSTVYEVRWIAAGSGFNERMMRKEFTTEVEAKAWQKIKAEAHPDRQYRAYRVAVDDITGGPDAERSAFAEMVRAQIGQVMAVQGIANIYPDTQARIERAGERIAREGRPDTAKEA